MAISLVNIYIVHLSLQVNELYNSYSISITHFVNIYNTFINIY